MMEVIELGVFGIIVSVDDEGAGTVESQLHEEDEPPQLGAALDAIESMVLAHACAGIDIAEAKYLEGIEGAVIACGNHYGD